MEEWPLEFPMGRTRNTCARLFLLKISKYHLCPELPLCHRSESLEITFPGSLASKGSWYDLPLRGPIIGGRRKKPLCSLGSYKHVCGHWQTADLG